MAKGHIKLGAVGTTAREYKLIDEHRYRRVTANPYSAKISTGGGTYDDLEPFAYWVQDDWQSGIGHKDPNDGLLFSTADTRVPNQIILPQRVLQSDTRNDDGSYSDIRNIGRLAPGGTLHIEADTTQQAAAIKFNFSGTLPAFATFSIYGKPNGTGATPTAGTISVVRGATPDSVVLQAGALSFESDEPYYRWHTATALYDTSGWVAGSGSTYWLVIDAPMDLVCTATYTSAETQVLRANGTTWEAVTGSVYPIFVTNFFALNSNNIIRTITYFNSTLYAGIGKQLLKYTVTTDTWAAVGSARTGNITDLEVLGTILHVALDSGTYTLCSTADVLTDAAGAELRSLFTRWNGYLWGKWGNNIYYTADGTTWSSAIPVGDSSHTITGIAGMGDTVYVATEEGLYYIAPGDIAVGVTRWGSKRTTNGTALVHHQGALYAVVDGGIAQISVNGGNASILPIWVKRDDDLVASYLERPIALVSCNNWLVCLVQQSSSPTKSSAWAWTGQGWHFLAETPMYMADTIYYDFSTSKLWMGSRSGVFFNVRVPDYTLNPVNDGGQAYVPSAWFETGWISGGLKDVNKDWEGVYINGDRLDTTHYVDIYYKDSRTASWTSLGKCDTYGEEVRWSDYTTRPTAKEIKLGFRLFTKSLYITPHIDVIRLKFMPNVRDRWQWSLPIEVGPEQELIDGTLNTYTVAQMTAHLDALIKSTPPFLLTDIDGTVYEVVCTGASVDLLRLDYYNAAFTPWWVYTLTIEQVRGATYA